MVVKPSFQSGAEVGEDLCFRCDLTSAFRIIHERLDQAFHRKTSEACWIVALRIDPIVKLTLCWPDILLEILRFFSTFTRPCVFENRG